MMSAEKIAKLKNGKIVDWKTNKLPVNHIELSDTNFANIESLGEDNVSGQIVKTKEFWIVN